MDSNFTLIDLLLRAADAWCAASEGTRARLGRTVVNDGGYFDRISGEGASTTTATLEKFAAYLGDPVNWPGGTVPDKVCEFVHRVEGRTPECCASTGFAPGVSRA